VNRGYSDPRIPPLSWSTSSRAFSQASSALSSACWRSLGLLAWMAAARWFMNVPSSSTSCSGSNCAKSRDLRSILSLANGIACCFLYRRRDSSASPKSLANGCILPLAEGIVCALWHKKKRSNFLELRACELRRIPLLRHWVNREQEGLEPRRGISTLPCPLLLRTHDHDRAVSVVDHGGGDASHQCSSHPAQAPASHDYEPST
jgi:hypothetical protein